MLLLSQIEARKIKPRSAPINLCTVLRSVQQEFAEVSDIKKIQCDVRCSENLALQSDEHLLSALLSILIENAIAYTPNGGSITLAAEALNGHVRCTVEDTGIGIPKADRANVFTKFYRASNALRVRSTGTGLGLYLATKITSLLHGSLTFVSKENKGTTFSVTFPRHP